ncbi:hypothetical protein FSP39_025354 [Pinctada imbricata]|uniref:C2H2-type domain-containing protein n=1 Tax=Pinctada imbricata TaxID=66713 RepID=A0AA88XNT6_PINIB|nr:hypothetical protein FSP39_025354 [Pinctada imbricata]
MDLSSKSHQSASAQGIYTGTNLALNFSQSESGRLKASPSFGESPPYKGVTSDTFPYGLSGVSMPTYGYPSDLYQFTPNGYPRKSRTCSYCSKVFTRSTTRRYHEKRCPLLRAAVCSSMAPEDSGKKGVANQRGQSIPTSSIIPQSVQETRSLEAKLQAMSGSHSKNHLKSTSPLHSSPSNSDDWREGNGYNYHTSVIVKKEAQDKSHAHSSTHNQQNDPTSRLARESQSSPLNHKMDLSTYASSPFSMRTKLDFSKIQGEESSPGSHEDIPKDDGYYLKEGSSAYMNNWKGKADNMETTSNISSQEVVNGTSVAKDEAHPEEVREDSKNDDGGSNETKCEVCGKIFPSSWQLHVHEQIHTKFKPYACRFCGDRFSKAALRITHEKVHLGDANYACAVCGANFTQKGSLRQHVRRRHHVGPWICRHCGTTSSSQKDLYDHLQTHDLSKNEDESLQCLIEAPGADDAEMMDEADGEVDDDGDQENEDDIMSDSNDNENSPGQESPVDNLPSMEEPPLPPADENEPRESCTLCGREYPVSHMAYHMKAHENQKPYSCPICGKRFGYKNNMKSHLKLHAGIKPYQCSICGAKFTRGSTLRRHARRHGISAESVWDLFVKNGNIAQQSGIGAGISGSGESPSSGSHRTPSRENRSTPEDLRSKKENTSGITDSPYSSLFNTPPSMSNATFNFFMNYHNHQAAVAAATFPSMFNTSLTSTSDIPPRLAGFLPSSQSPQKDALNLSVPKISKSVEPEESGCNSVLDQFSPTSVNAERSRPLVEPGSSRPLVTAIPSITANCTDVGVQMKNCCSTGPESMTTPGSPSDVSVHSDTGSTYQQSTSSGLDNSSESISTLLAMGRLYKCDHCECYFSEYAMYRIHSKLHVRGKSDPFVCPVCNENCHDKMYFALHLAEHLR